MPTVAKGKVATVPLAIGDILAVSSSGGVTNVWRVDPRLFGRPNRPRRVMISSGQSTKIGPFLESTSHRIDAMSGDATYTVTDRLGAELQRKTESIKSATVIAAALVNREGLTMALRDKFKALADRAKKLPADLEKQADAVSRRLDDLDRRGVNAFGAMHVSLDDVEAGVTATEDLVNQLTNGGPQIENKAVPVPK